MTQVPNRDAALAARDRHRAEITLNHLVGDSMHAIRAGQDPSDPLVWLELADKCADEVPGKATPDDEDPAVVLARLLAEAVLRLAKLTDEATA